MWNVQNVSIHGDNSKESRLERIQWVRQQVKELYADERQQYLQLKERDSFEKSVAQRIKQGINSMMAWCNLTEDQLERFHKQHQENKKASNIMKWLQREPLDGIP